MTQTVFATPAEIMNWYARGRRKFDGVGIAGCYANFEDCDLAYTIFSNAQLNGACFAGANLAGAVFHNAQLKTASFENANLSKASLYGADLRGASFRYANLGGTDLTFANLVCSYFDEATINKTNFMHADLTDANLEFCTFSITGPFIMACRNQIQIGHEIHTAKDWMIKHARFLEDYLQGPVWVAKCMKIINFCKDYFEENTDE